MNETTPLLTRHKLTVDAYYRMTEVGILAWGERVELIDGEIIDMPAIGTGHASVVSRINRALVRACGDQAIVSVQNPVRLDEYNEPQPDFAVLRPRADFYAAQHPGPADVLLLVEVADTSLRYDRAVKLPIYALAGIPEYWIVNLRDRVIRSYRSPSGNRFTKEHAHAANETLQLAAAVGIAVQVGDLLGEPPPDA